jgi:hypothetical protein
MDRSPLPEVGPHEADLSQLLDGVPLLGADSVAAIAAARAQSATETRQRMAADAERRASGSGREWEEAVGRAEVLAGQLSDRYQLEPERARALRSALKEAVLALVTWDLEADQGRELFMPVAEFFPLAHSERAG